MYISTILSTFYTNNKYFILVFITSLRLPKVGCFKYNKIIDNIYKYSKKKLICTVIDQDRFLSISTQIDVYQCLSLK